jgi:diguanylate cyclase (GGDEF)-like protein/PAS domain S-box-containing protein
MLVVVFYLFNRAVDLDEYGQIHALLTDLRQLDTGLDRDLLRIKAFRLNNYDPLVAARNGIQQRLAELQRYTREHAALGEAFGESLEASQRTLNLKLELGERIKTRGAVVRNTLSFLPLEIEAAALAAHPARQGLLTSLSSRLQSFFIFPDQSRVLDIQDIAQRLAETPGNPDNDDKIANILNHVRISLASMRKVDETYNRYFAAPAANRLNDLFDRYSDYHASHTRRADMVALVLLVTVIALFAGLAYSTRQVENARIASERARNKLRDAIESIDEGFALCDPQDRLLLWNRNFEQYYPAGREILRPGLSFRQFLRGLLDRHQFCLDESVERWYKRRLHDHKRGGKSSIEHLADGRSLRVADYKTSELGTATLLTDITELLDQENHLRQLSLAVEQSPGSVMISNLAGKVEYVNRRFEELSGYTREEVIGEIPALLKAGEGDDKVFAELWPKLQRGETWQGEFRNRRKSGETTFESASITPLRNSEGVITHYLTLSEDISARKAVEEQMHLSRAVFETTNEGILVTDARNQIIGVNPAFCRITGYSEEEVLGQTPAMLNSGYQDKAFYLKMWQEIQSGNQWAGEIWNRKKSGEVYPEWLSITTVRDEEGCIRHHVAVFSDISERKRAEEQIRWQANYDALTKLPNRSLFHDRLNQAVAAAHHEEWISALLFIDLDRFKIINDTFGHAQGDRLLREAAERLAAVAGEADTAARLGGDEFTLIMQDLPDGNAAARKAEEVIAEISRPFFSDGNKAHIGASIGIALYPDDAEDADTLMRNADLAMYKAKNSGRNQYHFYTQAMNDEIHARNRLETELHNAVEHGQFVTWFQPIIDIQRQRVYGAEALVRWQHPQRGLLGPAEFIPLAEECGLIGAIGEWVLEDACSAAAGWQSVAGEPLKLSVNLSNQQRLYGMDQDLLEAILRRTGLPPQNLTLEMTESILLDDDQAAGWLSRLKSAGVSLSIDDFGTGYSSLGYLQRLPFDILKIDKSFIDGIEGSDRERSLVRAILAIAVSLNLKVVAEGVENPAQYSYLREQQCDLVQGYLFSKPLDNPRFQAFVEAFDSNRAFA